MVGFNKLEENKLSKTDYAIAGCVSGFLGRACVQPIDVVKVRFQLQVEPINSIEASAKYKSILQAIQCINKEEGIRAFWKGHLSSQLLAVSYTTVQFASFEIYTQWFATYAPFLSHNFNHTGALSSYANFFCGCMAGITSAIFTQPLDVLKTRFIAQGEPRIYKNINEAIMCILRREGFKGLFKGLTPSILLTAPQTGLQFTTYKLTTNLISFVQKKFFYQDNRTSDDGPQSRIGIISSVFAGSTAGIISKCIVYPMDVAKKRLQVQGFEEARTNFGRLHSSKGLRDCFIIMCRDEGPTALFKGLKPSLFKSCVSIGCRFGVYEQTCSFLLSRKYQKPVE